LEEHGGAAGRSPHALPTELHLLFIGVEEPSWTRVTLQLDRYGCRQPKFHWCSQLSEAVRIVHQEHFDCIILDDCAGCSLTGCAGEQPVSAAVAALRTGGCVDPVLILSDRVDDEWLADMADADAELLVTRQGWRSPAMAPWIRCAIDRHTMAREHGEIGREGQERRVRDSSETQRLLEQRTALVARLRRDVKAAPPHSISPDRDVPAYLDLLRSSVLSDAAQLGEIMAETTAALAKQGLSAVDLLELHTSAVQQLVLGLGRRSARHVLQRTDLIGWEMLARLAACGESAHGFRRVADVGLELGRRR
jgi:hypothetical protein